MLGLFLLFHTKLLMKDSTTLETGSSNSDDMHRDQNAISNWRQIFGDDWRLWFVPIVTADLGKAIDFQTREPVVGKSSSEAASKDLEMAQLKYADQCEEDHPLLGF